MGDSQGEFFFLSLTPKGYRDFSSFWPVLRLNKRDEVCKKNEHFFHEPTLRTAGEKGMLNEEIYRFLIEKANDGVAIVQDRKFKYINPRLPEIVGYSSDEILHIPLRLIISAVELDKLIEKYERRLAGENLPSLSETCLKHKDGQLVYLELNAGVITYEGKPADLIIARDVTERKRTEEEFERTVEKLRKAMGATMQAITLTVETRDPCTAGHQRRVADLARSIADQMGLDKEKVEALRIAASIHDLGKISIPSEILSKPGRLNDNEFDLIKTHPQVGYDILKKIDFPWPIAMIVLQHHERVNGSGYPQGLKDGDIMREARILGVADVVEAMVSHRPYRTAHKLDVALDEISKNRDVLYDPEVVDSCVGLFQGSHFAFK
jgi:PAS domain S-box-containing protein/putative nucleotidyltransferase with HDIG domain